jgi:hypothetical protein
MTEIKHPQQASVAIDDTLRNSKPAGWLDALSGRAESCRLLLNTMYQAMLHQLL